MSPLSGKLPHLKQMRIAGTAFNFVLQDQVLQYILRWRQWGRRNTVVLANPHSVMLARRDAQMREATEHAELVLPDGVGVVLAAKLLGHGRRHRVTGPSIMLRICDQGRAHGLRHFFYGGAEGIAEKLAANLQAQFPGMIVAGCACPPFRALTQDEDQAMVDAINASEADVVWVGLGAPKQEKWMAAHAGEINAAATIGVGAAFDFHAGNVRWAPRWMRSWGLEWMYRLYCEPRRMWRRNLDSPLFLLMVLGQSIAAFMGRFATRIKPVVNPQAAARAFAPKRALVDGSQELAKVA